MAAEVHPATLHQRSTEFAEGPSFESNEMALDSNQWNQVFKLGIEKGEGYLLGRGQSANPLQAQGFLAMRMMDNTATTAAQITGNFRITVRASGSGRLVDELLAGDLEEYDSRDGNGDLKGRSDRTPFPRTDNEFVTHEYDVWLELKPDSDTTVDTAPDSGNTEIYADAFEASKTS